MILVLCLMLGLVAHAEGLPDAKQLNRQARRLENRRDRLFRRMRYLEAATMAEQAVRLRRLAANDSPPSEAMVEGWTVWSDALYFAGYPNDSWGMARVAVQAAWAGAIVDPNARDVLLRRLGTLKERIEDLSVGDTRADARVEVSQMVLELQRLEPPGVRLVEALEDAAVHELAQGRTEQAAAYCEEALSIGEGSTADLQALYGRVLMEQGRALAARAALTAALAAAEDEGRNDVLWRSIVQQDIGGLALAMADYTDAKVRFQDAIRGYRSLGVEEGVLLKPLLGLAEAEIRSGQPRAAINPLSVALDIARARPNAGQNASSVWLRLAEAQMAAQQYQTATPILEELLVLTTLDENHVTAMRHLEQIARLRGDDDEAKRWRANADAALNDLLQRREQAEEEALQQAIRQVLEGE